MPLADHLISELGAKVFLTRIQCMKLVSADLSQRSGQSAVNNGNVEEKDPVYTAAIRMIMHIVACSSPGNGITNTATPIYGGQDGITVDL